MSSSTSSCFTLEYRGRVAIITIANERKLNALSQEQYFELSRLLREVATHEEVFITVLIGRGRYFSAGADVSVAIAPSPSSSFPSASSSPSPASPDPSSSTVYSHTLRTFVANNLEITQAFYTHPKILVAALNGPVIGLSAALIGFADFVYAVPSAFLLTPFSSLGLVAEGGASRGLVQRLGLPLANEALIMSRRISCEELVRCGFVNKVFDVNQGEETGEGDAVGERRNATFREQVLKEIDERLGEHLIGDSMLKIKELIRRPERDVLDSQNVAEVFAGLDRFVKGIPQEEFVKIASGKKRHKL